jgi:hypothetical protein
VNWNVREEHTILDKHSPHCHLLKNAHWSQPFDFVVITDDQPLATSKLIEIGLKPFRSPHNNVAKMINDVAGFDHGIPVVQNGLVHVVDVSEARSNKDSFVVRKLQHIVMKEMLV